RRRAPGSGGARPGEHGGVVRARRRRRRRRRRARRLARPARRALARRAARRAADARRGARGAARAPDRPAPRRQAARVRGGRARGGAAARGGGAQLPLDGVRSDRAARRRALAVDARRDRLPARPPRRLAAPVAADAVGGGRLGPATGDAASRPRPRPLGACRRPLAPPRALLAGGRRGLAPPRRARRRLDGERSRGRLAARGGRRRRDRDGRPGNGRGYTSAAVKRLHAVVLFVLGFAAAGAFSGAVIADVTTSTSTSTAATTNAATTTTTTAPPPPANVVPPGVRVAGIRVGGLAPAEAVATVQAAFAR